eukprot:4428277-Amphidinium_carterae.1
MRLTLPRLKNLRSNMTYPSSRFASTTSVTCSCERFPQSHINPSSWAAAGSKVPAKEGVEPHIAERLRGKRGIACEHADKSCRHKRVRADL